MKSNKWVYLKGVWDVLAIRVPCPTLSNVIHGLVERVFLVSNGKGGLRKPTAAVAGAFNKLRDFRSRVLDAVVSCRPYTMDEFIATYSGAKQRIVRRAAESLISRPFTANDAMVKVFVKVEKLVQKIGKDLVPRIISPRDPRYNCIVGPYIKAAEKPIFEAIAKVWGGPTVMKGYDVFGVATHMLDMWRSFRDPVAVGLDASRFDQHVSVQALQYEHEFYNKLFNDSELARALSLQLHNIGVGFCRDGKVRFDVHGCRMSGDMNTSLGNCILMCAMVWQLCRDLKIPARLANNGDDCVVFMSRKHLVKFNNHVRNFFISMGFDMKVEPPVYEFERVEFCQTRPVFDGSRWRMCRNPTCMSKDLCHLHPLSIPYRTWLPAVGNAGSALYGDMPILGAFYRNIAGETSVSITEGALHHWKTNNPVSTSEPTSAARVSMFKAFGIPPWTQVAIEADITSSLNHCRPLTSERQPLSINYLQTLLIADRYNGEKCQRKESRAQEGQQGDRHRTIQGTINP